MTVMPHARSSVKVDFDVAARMRDGVTLRANVYRPATPGPWPTLLMRSPYGKDDARDANLWMDPVQAARSGFMVVVQDTRGCFASEGEWTPFRFEREDGYDSVEWAARLPGSNGRVGMYGSSYNGNTQWMAAIGGPPSLAALAPGLTWSEPLDGLFGRGGALELGLALPWTLVMGTAHIARLPLPDAERKRRIAALLDDYDRLTETGYWDLPLSDMAVLRREPVPDIGTFRMLSDPSVPDWCRVAGAHERVAVPTLHIGGWYDVFLQGTLDNYVAMAAIGRDCRLVIGPWRHDEVQSDLVGELSFGIRSNGRGPAHDLGSAQLSWFREHLFPEATREPDSPEAPVRIFVMGRNEWRDESGWPLERARVEKWFIGSGGSLHPDAPREDQPLTSFVYKPGFPVPTVGGPTVMEPAFPPGAFDQARVEARQDVCVFTSEALDADLEVTGRVRVILHVESSAPSTDWVARLCDVHPDGRSFNVTDGILRVTENANVRRRVEVDLWSTSMVFRAGHRLRVHVTSSSFPRWDRNLNTGNQDDPRSVPAHQRLYHDAQHASWIELPVVA